MTSPTIRHDNMVGILAPTGRDADVTLSVLNQSDISACSARSMEHACALITSGSSAMIIAEEALTLNTLDLLASTLAAQPNWSDYPLVILALPGRASDKSRSILSDLNSFTNATVLERPLRKSTLISTINVALRSRRRQLELRDRLAETDGLALQREEMLEQQRRIAETLQFSILESPPRNAFTNLEIETQYVPAGNEAMVGGDFFDAFSVDGRVALVVGDVVGKGLTAAAQMAEIKYALRAIVRQNPSPARALAQLNKYVVTGDRVRWKEDQTLVAVILALVDISTGKVSVAVAGAEPPIYARESFLSELVNVTGLPIGAAIEATYQSTTFQMLQGDLLFLATDGLTEARNGDNYFGIEGLIATVDKAKSANTTAEVASAIIADALAYTDRGFRDDVCLLVARWLGSDPANSVNIGVDGTPSILNDSEKALAKSNATFLSLSEQYLNRLTSSVQQAIEPEAVLWDVLTTIAQFLNVSSSYYAEFDQQNKTFVIQRDYCRDTPSIAGTLSISNLGEQVIEDLKNGGSVVIEDAMLDARTADNYDDSYAKLNIRAMAWIPLMRDGQLTGIMGVHDSSTRHWSARDLRVISETANVTRVVWENSCLNRRTQANAQQQRTFLRDVLMSVTQGHLILCDGKEDLPLRLAPYGDVLHVDETGGLAAARRLCASACAAAGLSLDRRYDLETAVSEAAMNAITHGGGGTVETFIDLDGAVQMCVTDHGSGISDENLPRATLAKGFSTSDTLGHGMKMMLQTADRVYLLTGDTGTIVVLEQSRERAHQLW